MRPWNPGKEIDHIHQKRKMVKEAEKGRAKEQDRIATQDKEKGKCVAKSAKTQEKEKRAKERKKKKEQHEKEEKERKEKEKKRRRIGKRRNKAENWEKPNRN